MSIAPAWQHCLAFFGTPLVIEPSPGQLSGDAGLLPIRQFDAMRKKGTFHVCSARNFRYALAY